MIKTEWLLKRGFHREGNTFIGKGHTIIRGSGYWSIDGEKYDSRTMEPEIIKIIESISEA